MESPQAHSLYRTRLKACHTKLTMVQQILIINAEAGDIYHLLSLALSMLL